jgi:hypothetical protein
MKNAVISLVAGAGLLLAAVGCGKSTDTRPVRNTTHGTLTYNGAPLKGAVVTLWPYPLDQIGWKTVKPAARVDADGTYHVNTYEMNDGAPIGEYAVCVMYFGDNEDNPRPDFFQGKYSQPGREVMKVTIKEGDNELPPIKLTGPPIRMVDVPGTPGT